MYAKIKDNAVVTFPYGFDELQAEFSSPLTGYVDIPSKFSVSQAHADGYRVVEVAQQKKPLAHSAGERHVMGTGPELVDGAWVVPWKVEQVPYPTDGKVYDWDPRARQWVEA